MHVMFRKILIISIALLTLGMFAVSIIAMAMLLQGNPDSFLYKSGLMKAFKEILPLASVVLILLSALVISALPLAAEVEVLTSKNSLLWKTEWSAALLGLNLVGFSLYLFYGRKQLI